METSFLSVLLVMSGIYFTENVCWSFIVCSGIVKIMSKQDQRMEQKNKMFAVKAETRGFLACWHRHAGVENKIPLVS